MPVTQATDHAMDDTQHSRAHIKRRLDKAQTALRLLLLERDRAVRFPDRPREEDNYWQGMHRLVEIFLAEITEPGVHVDCLLRLRFETPVKLESLKEIMESTIDPCWQDDDDDGDLSDWEESADERPKTEPGPTTVINFGRIVGMLSAVCVLYSLHCEDRRRGLPSEELVQAVSRFFVQESPVDNWLIKNGDWERFRSWWHEFEDRDHDDAAVEAAPPLPYLRLAVVGGVTAFAVALIPKFF